MHSACHAHKFVVPSILLVNHTRCNLKLNIGHSIRFKMSVISPTSDLWLSYELAYFHFFTLQDMKRPFKPMKDLDMDEVVSDIVAKLK